MAEMRAVSVIPGASGSARLTVHPRPVLASGQVLVRVLATGVCGTDREILAGHIGTSPAGEKRLIIGHECLGEVVLADAQGTLPPGTLVTPVVRRPDGYTKRVEVFDWPDGGGQPNLVPPTELVKRFQEASSPAAVAAEEEDGGQGKGEGGRGESEKR